MLIFIDTAIVDEVREMTELGVIDGATTNPSLMARAGRTDYKNVVQEICYLVQGPVSAEVVGATSDEMIAETREIVQWSPHVAVKVPFTEEGLRTLKELRYYHANPEEICGDCPWLGKCDTPLDEARRIVVEETINFNVTLIFSLNQALIAAKGGAAFISPFIGRLDDAGNNGMKLIKEIRTMLDNYTYPAQIITASVRHPQHVVEAAVLGSDIATVPYAVLKKALRHPLTDAGVKRFTEDWEAVKEKVGS